MCLFHRTAHDHLWIFGFRCFWGTSSSVDLVCHICAWWKLWLRWLGCQGLCHWCCRTRRHRRCWFSDLAGRAKACSFLDFDCVRISFSFSRECLELLKVKCVHSCVSNNDFATNVRHFFDGWAHLVFDDLLLWHSEFSQVVHWLWQLTLVWLLGCMRFRRLRRIQDLLCPRHKMLQDFVSQTNMDSMLHPVAQLHTPSVPADNGCCWMDMPAEPIACSTWSCPCCHGGHLTQIWMF